MHWCFLIFVPLASSDLSPNPSVVASPFRFSPRSPFLPIFKSHPSASIPLPPTESADAAPSALRVPHTKILFPARKLNFGHPIPSHLSPPYCLFTDPPYPVLSPRAPVLPPRHVEAVSSRPSAFFPPPVSSSVPPLCQIHLSLSLPN